MRFDRLVPIAIVCTTFLDLMSMIDTPPSRECALQTSRPFGDRSMPSGPLPTGITVCVQTPFAPCWIADTLSLPMFEVKTFIASLVASTMCVVVWPVSNCHSIRSRAGS